MMFALEKGGRIGSVHSWQGSDQRCARPSGRVFVLAGFTNPSNNVGIDDLGRRADRAEAFQFTASSNPVVGYGKLSVGLDGRLFACLAGSVPSLATGSHASGGWDLELWLEDEGSECPANGGVSF